MAGTAAAGAQASTESAATTQQQTTPPTAGAAAAGSAAGASTETPGAGKTTDAGKTTEGATKTTDGTTTEPGGKAGEQTTQPKAPAKYELAIPTGGELYVDTEHDLAFVEQVARANDWTNDEAQAEIVAAVTRAQQREQAQGAKYLEAFKADKDYGGDKLAETQRQAKAAVDRVFPPGHRLREAFLATFNRPIVGNNLTYVAFLAEVGKLMGEDAPGATRSSTQGAGGGDAASKLYDHPDSRALDKSA